MVGMQQVKDWRSGDYMIAEKENENRDKKITG